MRCSPRVGHLGARVERPSVPQCVQRFALEQVAAQRFVAGRAAARAAGVAAQITAPSAPSARLRLASTVFSVPPSSAFSDSSWVVSYSSASDWFLRRGRRSSRPLLLQRAVQLRQLLDHQVERLAELAHLVRPGGVHRALNEPVRTARAERSSSDSGWKTRPQQHDRRDHHAKIMKKATPSHSAAAGSAPRRRAPAARRTRRPGRRSGRRRRAARPARRVLDRRQRHRPHDALPLHDIRRYEPASAEPASAGSARTSSGLRSRRLEAVDRLARRRRVLLHIGRLAMRAATE